MLLFDVVRCQTLQLSSRCAHGAKYHLQVVPVCNEIPTGLDWQSAHFLAVRSERSDRNSVKLTAAFCLAGILAQATRKIIGRWLRFQGEPLRRYGFQENIQDGTVSRSSLSTVRVPRRTPQIRQCYKTGYKTVLQTGLGRGAPACGLGVVFQAESHQHAGGVLRSRQNPPRTGGVAHSAKCAVDW